MPDTGAAGAPASWQRNLFFTWISQFLSLAGFCFGMPFIAYYMQELGVKDKTELYIYMGAFTAGAPIALALMGPVWGVLSDRHGRKLMMLRASTAATFVLFGMGYTGSITGLLVFRFLQGFFTGTMPAAQALVASHTPDSRQGFALGTLSTATYSGIMAGGFLGGRCADVFGYAATFKIGGCIMIVSTLLIVFGIREQFEPPAEIPGGAQGFRLPSIGLAGPVLVLIGAVACVRFLESAILPLFIQHLNHDTVEGSSTITGDLTAVACFAGIIGGYLFGWLVDRVSPEPIGKVVVCGSALAMAAQSISTSFTGLFLARFVLAFFSIGMDPVMQVWVSRVTPNEQRGSIFGWVTTCRSLGWVVGPLIGSGLAAGIHQLTGDHALAQRSVFLTDAVLLVALVPVVGWSARRMLERNGEAAQGETAPTVSA